MEKKTVINRGAAVLAGLAALCVLGTALPAKAELPAQALVFAARHNKKEDLRHDQFWGKQRYEEKQRLGGRRRDYDRRHEHNRRRDYDRRHGHNRRRDEGRRQRYDRRRDDCRWGRGWH